MTTSDCTIWGIHAGRAGEADELFRKHNCIAIGDLERLDLTTLPPSREAFKAVVSEYHPEASTATVSIWAGIAYRFLNEIKLGDFALYPSKVDRHVHIGEVVGPYRYNPRLKAEYPHQRQVRWLKSVPRTHFTQGALHEIGSAVTLFQVRNYAEEVLSALEGQSMPAPVAQDETVAIVAEEIEENTRDFVLKKLAQELKGHPFAHFVAHLLGTMGYRTRVSPEGPDGGVDIIAHKDELGFEPPIIKVQVKSTEGNIGDPVVSALYGKVSSGEYGLLVTLGKFTASAVNFARGRSNLRLIDGEELVQLILEHYEQFDSRYKGLLPLKRVYVPVALEEGEA